MEYLALMASLMRVVCGSPNNQGSLRFASGCASQGMQATAATTNMGMAPKEGLVRRCLIPASKQLGIWVPEEAPHIGS